VIYSICTDILAVSGSSSRQHDTSPGPVRSAAGHSQPRGKVSATARSPRRRRRRAAADRQRLTSTVATAVATAGGGVLKEEPVQFPVTFHTSAAYFATTIKLYATFSMYFRVRSFKHVYNIIKARRSVPAKRYKRYAMPLSVCLSVCPPLLLPT